MAQLGKSGDEGLERRLASLVSELGDSERRREEGSRELGLLLRDLEGVRGEGLEVDLRLEALAGLGGPSRVGWTGEVHDGLDELAEEDESPPASPLSPTTPTTKARRGLLPRRTAELSAHMTIDLAHSLGTVLERSNLSLASIAGTQRQLKGVRVALRSFRATQDHEDECAAGVARFEEREAAGRRRDVRGEMAQVLEGFERTLERAEADWKRLRSTSSA